MTATKTIDLLAIAEEALRTVGGILDRANVPRRTEVERQMLINLACNEIEAALRAMEASEG